MNDEQIAVLKWIGGRRSVLDSKWFASTGDDNRVGLRNAGYVEMIANMRGHTFRWRITSAGRAYLAELAAKAGGK